MKKFNSRIILFLIFFLSFLSSCQSIQDGLSGRKSENSDEFLVQKKNPLVMPPDFMKLPKPSDSDENSEIANIEEETDIQKILDLDQDQEKISNKSFDKAEEFVLENIKQ